MESMKQDSNKRACTVMNNLVVSVFISLMLVTILALSTVVCLHQSSIGMMKHEILMIKQKHEQDVAQLGQEMKTLKESLSQLKSGTCPFILDYLPF